MASNLNLKRNSRVFFTTNVAPGTNKVQSTITAATTQELTVLDGFSFSQGVNAQAVTVNEAGATPTRGQRSFNTALNPVEFSFSTYVRPNVSGGNVLADEAVLWNALFSNADSTSANNVTFTGATVTTATIAASTGILTVIGTSLPTTATVNGVYTLKGLTGAYASAYNTPVQVLSSSATTFTAQYLTAPSTAACTAMTSTLVPATAVLSVAAWNPNAAVATDTLVGNTAYAEVTTARSDLNQLLPFGLIITVDGVTYTIDNCALDTAQIDFGLDGIATVQWAGKGTQLNVLSTNITYGGTVASPTMSGPITGTATGKSAVVTTRYITNKLSTALITANIGGGGQVYTLALTGGNMQISNGLNYITPANLGVVNVPIGYYTATRAITGSVNAYLRTGGGATKTTGDLLSQILQDSTTNGVTETKYQISLQVGGSTNATRVDIAIDGAALQVPTIDAGQDIVSTVINFTAQGTDALKGTAGANYDLTSTNDLRIRYFSN